MEPLHKSITIIIIIIIKNIIPLHKKYYHGGEIFLNFSGIISWSQNILHAF